MVPLCAQNNEELIALYAFNPKKENFDNSIKLDLISSESKIELIRIGKGSQNDFNNLKGYFEFGKSQVNHCLRQDVLLRL